ncbi:WG repeat-containing protein [uncultured Flavobacterium sp.]|uniref:WG repeat-containing protein n=1 Tax=uncultured Flavobacterium sp. TaxID=165435 RepID=UPI0030C7D775
MKNFSYLLLPLLFSNIVNAQQKISDKQILKHIKAKKIEWIPGGNSLAKVQMKSNKKWGIYFIDAHSYSGEIEIDSEEVVAPKFDSIGWFTKMEPLTIVKNNKKYGILMNPYEIQDAADKAKCKYDAIKIKEVEGRFYTLVKEGNLWGLVDWFEDVSLVDPSFENPEDVPLIWVESWAIDTFKESKKQLNADILIFDESNGDNVFKARNKDSKKWGMYQSLGSRGLTTLILANYDSVSFFPFNGKYTAVYKNEKVGFYLSYWSYYKNAKQTVPCAYDDYKSFDANGIPKLAVKKNDKWGWIDWLTGEEKSEFIYLTTKDLPYPHFKQEIWIEE